MYFEAAIVVHKKRSQRSNGIPSLLMKENPLTLVRNDIEKAPVLLEYFIKVFSISDKEMPTIHCDCRTLLIDRVAIEKYNVLRLLQHLKPDMSTVLDDIHPRFMKDLSDVITEPLTILDSLDCLDTGRAR